MKLQYLSHSKYTIFAAVINLFYYTVNLKLNSSKAVYSRRLKNVPFPKEIRVFEP